MINDEQEIEDFIIPLSPETAQIKDVIMPLLRSSGFELVWIKLVKNGGATNLGLFIDRLGEASITVDDLAVVSRLLGDVFDVELADSRFLSGHYNLEVSSPGLDRPLSRKRDFSENCGQQVQVKTVSGAIPRISRLSGTLVAVHEDGISVESPNSGEHRLVWSAMQSAHKIWSPARAGKAKTKKKVKKLGA